MMGQGGGGWGNEFTGNDWFKNQKQQQQFQMNTFDMNNTNIADFIQQQIIQLEPSPAQKTIEELRAKGQKFRDDRFPPNKNSLTGEWGNVSEWNSIKW